MAQNTFDTRAMGGVARLALRTDLPTRARSLLQAALDISRTHLGATLNGAIEEYDKLLLHLSDTSRGSTMRQDFLVSYRALAGTRTRLSPRFLERIEYRLASYDRDEENAGAPRASGSKPWQDLSLLGTSELEESLAIQEFISHNEVRHAQALYELGHRFAVLVALPPLEAGTLPIGPAMIGEALRYTASLFPVDFRHRALLYQTFTRHAARQGQGKFYEELNTLFVNQRILSHLRSQAQTQTGGRQRAQNEPPANAPASAATPAAEPVPPGTQGAANAAALPPPPPVAAHDLEAFTALRQLLANQRNAGASAPNAGAAAPQATVPAADAAPSSAAPVSAGQFIPSEQDLQNVLGSLQALMPAAPGASGKPPHLRSAGEIKQELVEQLREHSPGHAAPKLAAEDSDTIDLVGMLFDQMSGAAATAGQPHGKGTQQLLGRLQVPLMRVALRDKSFFSRNDHPARQLLNALADTGERWMDGSDPGADADLQNKLEVLLDHFSTNFNGDPEQIDSLIKDLDQQSHTLARKAQAAERRQVDAALSREALAIARETATKAMADRIQAEPSSRLVRILLEQSWVDVLTLTLLRHGEDSPAYRRRIKIAERLIKLVAATEKGDVPPPAEAREVSEDIQTGLSQVGYHDDDIQTAVRRLLLPEEAANEEEVPADKPSATEADLIDKLTARPRFGGEDGTVEEKPLAAAASRRQQMQLDETEQANLEKLRQLPQGTWFEFLEENGNRVRRKMAWVSKLTGRCLFLTTRGARAELISIEELARRMKQGQAFIAKPDADTFVDRAWATIVGTLRRIGTAFAPTPPPHAAGETR